MHCPGAVRTLRAPGVIAAARDATMWRWGTGITTIITTPTMPGTGEAGAPSPRRW